MATWKLTPDTGQVTGTHTDMPLVVIPSVLEMGAITLAEAQSSRFYSDVDLTTELAREVVSADEIHVKVPSASGSTEIWMDFDGVRSDYAVTATYGRNAVWSGYKAVHHGDGLSDASGNLGNLTNTGSVAYVDGKVGKAFDGGTANSTKRMAIVGASPVTATDVANAITWSTWLYAYATKSGSVEWVNQLGSTGTTKTLRMRLDNGGSPFTLLAQYENGFATVTNAITAGQWYHVALIKSGTNVIFYVNGSPTSFSYTTGNGGAVNYHVLSHAGSGNTSFFSGMTDEVKISADTKSANWITTEYNNQNDNAAFWVAVEEAASSSIKSIGGLAKADIKSMAEIIIG